MIDSILYYYECQLIGMHLISCRKQHRGSGFLVTWRRSHYTHARSSIHSHYSTSGKCRVGLSLSYLTEPFACIHPFAFITLSPISLFQVNKVFSKGVPGQICTGAKVLGMVKLTNRTIYLYTCTKFPVNR